MARKNRILILIVLIVLVMMMQSKKEMKKMAGEELQTGYTPTTDGEMAPFDSVQYGQTFIAPDDFTLSTIKLFGRKSGNPSALTLAIQPTSEGLPTGIDLISTLIDVESLSTTNDVVIVDISYELSGNTQYAIIVRGGNISNRLILRHHNLDGYADGTVIRSTNGGTSWIKLIDDDFWFEVWGISGEPPCECSPSECCSDGCNYDIAGTPCTGGECDGLGTCIPTGPVCGDDVCEAGENCPADAVGCPDNTCYEPICTNGCGETPVSNGGNDEGCIMPNFCDGSGICTSCEVTWNEYISITNAWVGCTPGGCV